MSEPLVSVIIPCYNSEAYVGSALESVINQSYKNLQIIVVDDCSTDGTYNILKQFEKQDSRIILIRNEINLKLVKTLNKMLSMCEGKYIARMDSDDICLPTRIEKQVAFLESNVDVDVCGTNAWIINENGKKIGKSFLPIEKKENKYFLKFFSTVYHPSVVIRSEVLQKEKYDECYLYAEDYEMWARLVYNKGKNICNLSERLFCYRTSKEQSGSVHQEKQWANSAKIFDAIHMIDEKNCEMHKDIFFLRRKLMISNETREYIKELSRQLALHSWNVSWVAYEKMIYYVMKSGNTFLLLQIVMRPLGIYTIIKNIIKKAGKFSKSR